MTTYSELVKRFREQNSKQSKTSWRYESWADSARDAQQVAERSQWMEKPLEPAPWDKPETPWWEEKHEPAPWDAKEGGIVEPGVTHYGGPGSGQKGITKFTAEAMFKNSNFKEFFKKYI